MAPLCGEPAKLVAAPVVVPPPAPVLHLSAPASRGAVADARVWVWRDARFLYIYIFLVLQVVASVLPAPRMGRVSQASRSQQMIHTFGIFLSEVRPNEVSQVLKLLHRCAVAEARSGRFRGLFCCQDNCNRFDTQSSR